MPALPSPPFPAPQVATTMLPSVAIMFAAVEGGRELVARTAPLAATIHHSVVTIMSGLLQHVASGYMCRVWDGELKYMLAFSSPQVRL